MKLLIDIGNTSAKLAVSDSGTFVHFERLSQSWSEAFSRLYRKYYFDKIVLSSVAAPDAALDAALVDIAIPCERIRWNTPCPIKPLTCIPEGYGADRIAADFGALIHDSEHTLLIIDAGTCVTYDLFSSSGEMLGGVISPGVQLRLRAMHDHTALLPLVQATPSAELMSLTTEGNLLSGAVNGTRYEIIGYIREVKEQYPDLHVFITGGNDFPVPADLADIVVHDPFLVLRGLDII